MKRKCRWENHVYLRGRSPIMINSDYYIYPSIFLSLNIDIYITYIFLYIFLYIYI